MAKAKEEIKVLRTTPPEELAREEKVLRSALSKSGWKITAAASVLDRHPSVVWGMLKRFPGLDAERREKREGAAHPGRKSVVGSKRSLLELCRKVDWNLDKAAKKLKCSRRTVRDWVTRFELEETYRRVRFAA